MTDWSQHSTIQRAICLSVALHAALLLAVRPGAFALRAPGFAPEWHLRIEEADDRIVEHGVVAPARRAPVSPAVSTPTPPDTSVVAEFTDAIVQQSSAGNDVETTDNTAAPAAAPDATEFLTTTAQQGARQVSTVPGRSMTSAERAMVAGRIKGWSRKFPDSGPIPATMTWRENGRPYTAEFTRRPATSVTDLERVDIVVTTEEDGRSLRSRLQLTRLAFSHFAQLVDQWDQNVQLHDDEIHGRFHSNSQILIGWDRGVMPRFFGQVTTTSGYKIVSEPFRRSWRETFAGGLETRAQRILMPRLFPAGTGTQNAQRRQFDVDTQIVFYADGNYGWRGLDAPVAAERREPIGSGPVYLLAGRGAVLQVRGTVRGTVLVYSPAQIVITGNLTYARDARQSGDADDYLGLVSDRDIVIADARVTGPGDLNIDAAIYARGQFRVRDIDSGPKAVLAIYGSLSAGSISASEPRYATRIEFDRRFEHMRPPDFPMTSRYELQQWDAQWDPAEQ